MNELIAFAEKVRNDVYQAATAQFEGAESKQLIHGNGHHMAQKISSDAYWMLIERSRDPLNIIYKSADGNSGVIWDVQKQKVIRMFGDVAIMRLSKENLDTLTDGGWSKAIHAEGKTEAELKELEYHLEDYGGGWMIAFYGGKSDADVRYAGQSMHWSRQPMISDPFPSKDAAVKALNEEFKLK